MSPFVSWSKHSDQSLLTSKAHRCVLKLDYRSTERLPGECVSKLPLTTASHVTVPLLILRL